MREDVEQALERDLARAAELPAGELESIRHRVFCSDEDGFMLIPAFWGDPVLNRALFEATDIHEHGPCPLQRWLREELGGLASAAEKQWGPALRGTELDVQCIGGKRGIDPELCEVQHSQGRHIILIGHAFYHVMLVLARACAARVRLHDGEEYNDVSAKEINDSLRELVALHIADATPRTDAIASKLLAHQLLAAELLARSFRRFIIARGIARIVVRQSQADPGMDQLLRQGLPAFGDVPPDVSGAWVEGLTCDLAAYALMQQAAHAAAADRTGVLPGAVQISWDFAAVCLWLTAKACLLRLARTAGAPLPVSDPPAEVRLTCLDTVFPAWSRPLGQRLSRMTHYRFSALFVLG
jgi:hypothetical protein